MAISKKTRIFEINNKKYRFNKNAFIFVFEDFTLKNQISKEKLEINIAEKLSLSSSAIHNWRNGLNGPSCLKDIKSVADFFNIDYFSILQEDKHMNNHNNSNNLLQKSFKYTDLQLLSIKRIYDEIIVFLNEFKQTGGFTTHLWYVYKDQGYDDPESKIYDYVEEKLEVIFLAIDKEYFYLHDLPIYEKIINYCNEDLFDIFDSKLSYAYRFNAYINGNPTTTDDYNKALTSINSIINNCVKNNE